MPNPSTDELCVAPTVWCSQYAENVELGSSVFASQYPKFARGTQPAEEKRKIPDLQNLMPHKRKKRHRYWKKEKKGKRGARPS